MLGHKLGVLDTYLYPSTSNSSVETGAFYPLGKITQIPKEPDMEACPLASLLVIKLNKVASGTFLDSGFIAQCKFKSDLHSNCAWQL